ncbi:type I-B CRISPR-associated protein Cas5 [Rhodonellum sp.]|uniref:type I-B CRISPR-associated protein Cas5 n=1 Tax=Rhodonellum sp. TaxID=2231180 RepID=UPI002727F35C|nr:type I-B CRISPR-associated protein Cas5 [Rhodonellum sp.]MDO9554413.1 type I-B CRISPR-associated protein Cas5 [Rhodonellum sp.]
MERLVSIDLESDFGFLRKPDTNEGISMSYNMLHKPSLLGIFGAVLGLDGYQKRGVLPDYYQQLQHLKVGIAPLRDERGNFQKTTIIYTNTVGYANKDGNFIAYENTLISPSYRVYVALSDENPLYHSLKNGQAEYIPYLGKNEFPVWWKPESFQEYALDPFDFDQEYQVASLFCKKDGESSRIKEFGGNTLGFAAMFTKYSQSFFYFERLPVGFHEFEVKKRGKEYQYQMAPFVYSNAKFASDYRLENLYRLKDNQVVQLN